MTQNSENKENYNRHSSGLYLPDGIVIKNKVIGFLEYWAKRKIVMKLERDPQNPKRNFLYLESKENEKKESHIGDDKDKKSKAWTSFARSKGKIYSAI